MEDYQKRTERIWKSNRNVLRETLDVLVEEDNAQMSAMLALACVDGMWTGMRGVVGFVEGYLGE